MLILTTDKCFLKKKVYLFIDEKDRVRSSRGMCILFL